MNTLQTNEISGTQTQRSEKSSIWDFNCDPIAHPVSVKISNNLRVTVLSQTVLRIEYNSEKQFEDRPSQQIWFRRRPSVKFGVQYGENRLEIITGALRLVCEDTLSPLSGDTLYIDLLNENKRWRYGDTDDKNLGGTVRTLDKVNGAAPLPPGLLSKNGWTALDDSNSLVYDENFWPTARKADSTDLYFFGYGKDYKNCLKEFCALSGSIALPPRFAFGNWWSRYWPYSQNQLMELVLDFEHHRLPLSVCVADMDWHIVDNPHHKGWTGYTWNKDLFYDPEGFFAFLHKKGIRSCLNLHPADGVHPHEEPYASMAEHTGIDPQSGEAVEFDAGDPQFMSGYFQHLHHPLEKQGVDFWWIDWQQGSESSIEGLDPLYQLNHLHTLDMLRSGRRPLILSRHCGPGAQRYPIGFSGDTHVTWKSLAFQPYFTAAAANVGFSYWSHDIGGHYKGKESPELYVRWIQFGVFSPIFRIHSANNLIQDRRPFVYDLEILKEIRSAMRLRHSLIPYIYSCCHITEKDSIPFIRHMYIEHPNDQEAYECGGQYYFGTSLIAAPFTSPVDPQTKLSSQSVWLPDGCWYNFFTGEYIRGGQTISVSGGLDTIPVYAKAGSVIVCAAPECLEADKNPHSLNVKIFAGESGSFILYEDDGQTLSYKKSGKLCVTVLKQEWYTTCLEINIGALRGECPDFPKKRTWTLEIFGITDECEISLFAGGEPLGLFNTYDRAKQCMKISIREIDVNKKITLEFKTKLTTLLSKRNYLSAFS
ncbi:MAG: glycoside hydrolase family 31 protein, partial [Chitinispirillia bacterium]|nr:glycoside hydrolase family 31 protein [Chitinispirillia bacterium]